MIIHHLSLSDFRVFKRIELDFPSHLNILVGQNAQGKTSILEAIHFISLMTSPVARHDREVINFLNMESDIPVGRIIADVEKKDKKHRIEVRIIFGKNGNGGGRVRKEVLIDGAKKKLFDTVGYFNSVIFLPQMTRIIEDGPDERRRYLDRTLSQAFPGYMRALSAYNQAIIRRNALLKQLAEQGGSQDQLDFWDGLIAEHGSQIISLRKKAITDLRIEMQKRHQQLTNGMEQLELQYVPAMKPAGENHAQAVLFELNQIRNDEPVDEIKEEFLSQLQNLRSEEIRRGVTTIGPHRDELRFLANDRDLGFYGSRGQIRTAIMALKLAEVYWLKEKTGETPVLLLDETLAELDQRRRADLLAELEANSQSIMTTTELDLFPADFVNVCSVRKLQDGKVLEN